jgi:hypothetical protein
MMPVENGLGLLTLGGIDGVTQVSVYLEARAARETPNSAMQCGSVLLARGGARR